MAEQITINVTDQIPAKNQATIDLEGQTGNTYAKSQLDEKLKEAKSGIKGSATQTNAPTVTPWTAKSYVIGSYVAHSGKVWKNSAATAAGDVPGTSAAWVEIPDGLFESYKVPAPITSPNSWGNLTVTQAELDANYMFFDVTNGVVSKELSKKSVADPAKIVTWTATTFASGAQVIHEGRAYQSNAATVAGDVPGVSTKWDIKLGELSKLKGVTVQAGTVVANYASETWETGKYIHPDGSVRVLASFSYSTSYISVIEGEVYSFTSSGHAIAWYDANKAFISISGAEQDAPALRSFTAPINAQFARINQPNTLLSGFSLTSAQKISVPELKIQSKQIEGHIANVDYSATKPMVNTIANALTFANYPIAGNVVVSGDSTIASYLGGTALSAILTATGTMTTIAVPGHTINQQIAAWNALTAGVRSTANYVFIQIGLNDLLPSESAVDVIGRLQNFINKVKTDAPNAIIVNGTMLPCKARLIKLYGTTDGLISFKKWQTINYFIENKLILNVDFVASEHTYQLDDGSGNLSSDFNTGDGIHENTAGRKIIAYSWISVL